MKKSVPVAAPPAAGAQDVAQAKVDSANEERSLHWMSENMELVALRKQVATLRLHCASYDFLSDAKDEIWELLIAVRDSFDGSEYQQGKKDGLRSALAILGTPEMTSFNRGNGMARDNERHNPHHCTQPQHFHSR